jgi:isopentenyl diphosphate isomerase/L-lactate dehydrogenase-like FMN-dependent dehydrogenase
VAAGLDIDSYRIVTMKGKASLERKTAAQLIELKNYFKLPFMVKGVASEEDVQLVEEVKPDIVVISNHGGRVFDKGRGTAYILHDYGKRLKNCCGQLWVDGGLRSAAHLAKSAALGADRVLIGRPFIQATAVFGEKGIGICLDGWGL